MSEVLLALELELELELEERSQLLSPAVAKSTVASALLCSAFGDSLFSNRRDDRRGVFGGALVPAEYHLLQTSSVQFTHTKVLPSETLGTARAISGPGAASTRPNRHVNCARE